MLSTHPPMNTSCLHLLALVRHGCASVSLSPCLSSLWVCTQKWSVWISCNFMFTRNLHIDSSSTLNLVAGALNKLQSNTHSPSLHPNPEQPLPCFYHHQPGPFLSLTQWAAKSPSFCLDLSLLPLSSHPLQSCPYHSVNSLRSRHVSPSPLLPV